MQLGFRIVILIFFWIASAASTAFADQNVTIQGRLLEADLTPITSNSVQFVIQVRSSNSDDCLLYEETQTLDLNVSQGAFALVLGQGTRSAASIDGGNSLQKVFSNTGTISLTAATTPCATAATSYTPGTSGTRIVNVTYNDGTGWDTIPAIPLSWVPQAMYAQDAGTLGGVSATAYALHAQFPTCSTGDFLTKTASGTYSCESAAASLGIIESVSSTNNYITAVTSGTDVYLTANLGTAALYNIGTTSGSIPMLNSSGTLSEVVIPTNILTSSTVFAGDLSGLPASLTITAVGGKPASQIATSVNDTQAATATATASTIVKRDSSGGISVTGLSLNNLYLYNASNYLQLRSSTSLSSNYILTFPAALGASGTILSTDGAGQLAWVTPLPSYSGDVTSTSGTSTLTLANSGVVSGTYGTVSVDIKGRVTSGNALSASDIATALGYTPANSATAAGGSLLSANNLSDLASSATARSNLGLGAVSLIDYIDLSSSYASGTLAAARLPGYSGDVTSVSGSAYLTIANSGVASATYTKVSVNAKGLITSGSSITSSDVTTALGYTPANSATIGITSLNGSSSATQSFALGSFGTTPGVSTAAGVHTLNFPLASTTGVTGGLLSYADYTTFMNKITSSAASIAEVLGYTPISATTLTGKITSSAASIAEVLGYVPANSAAGGITSLNGSISATQTYGFGSFGVSPGVSTAAGVHTFNFPLASTTGVTGGLLSYADYTTFMNKVTSSAASIAEVLGYTPISATTLTGKITSSAASITEVLGFAPASASALTGKITSSAASIAEVLGYAPISATTLTGKITSSAASITEVLGFAPASASALTGKITSSAASIAEVLGYTPISATTLTGKITSSAASITEVLGFAPASASALTGKITSSAASIAEVLGYTPISATTLTGKITSSAASITEVLGFAPASASALTGKITSSAASIGEVLGYTPISATTLTGKITSSAASIAEVLGYTPANSSTVGIISLNGSSLGTQSFALGSFGTTPGVSTAAGVHTLNFPLASTAGVTGGLLSYADYATFINKITSSAASIAEVLGYTPISATTLTGKITSSAASITEVLGFAPASASALTGKITSSAASIAEVLGYTPISATTLTGKITSSAASIAEVLGFAPASASALTGKITSSAASIAEVLGYTPANSATALAVALLKANNLSDLASATTARANLELGTAATLNVGTAANNIVQLDTSSRFPAVDGSLVTNITRNNIATAAVNHVVINSSSGTLTSEATLAISRGGTAASSFSSNALIMTNGTGTAFTSATCSGGEILRWNSVSGSWACTSILAAVSNTAIVNNGNTLGASVTIGTIDNNDVNIKSNNTLRIHVSNGGNVGIGLGANVAASTTLQVGGILTPQTDNTTTLGSASNRWSTVYAGSAVINTSDRREKARIHPIELGLDFISQLKPVSYYWKKGFDQQKHYGFIAQDVEKVLKNYTHSQAIVDHDKETDRYGIRYTELISPLVKSVQELNGKLTQENTRLHQEVDQLKQYICAKDPTAVFCKTN